MVDQKGTCRCHRAYRDTHTAQETFEWLGLTKQTYYRRIKELKAEMEQSQN